MGVEGVGGAGGPGRGEEGVHTPSVWAASSAGAPRCVPSTGVSNHQHHALQRTLNITKDLETAGTLG